MGPGGLIAAFNFPVAPWAWNFALAIVCGDPMIWKPSELTPLSALACAYIFEKAAARFGDGAAPPRALATRTSTRWWASRSRSASMVKGPRPRITR